MMGRRARASIRVMRLWKPHDLGRSCLRFTIRHHVTNETDSQNAGALGLFVTAVVRWFMPQICPKPTAGAHSRFMAGHRGCAHEERPDDRAPHGCCNLV